MRIAAQSRAALPAASRRAAALGPLLLFVVLACVCTLGAVVGSGRGPAASAAGSVQASATITRTLTAPHSLANRSLLRSGRPDARLIRGEAPARVSAVARRTNGSSLSREPDPRRPQSKPPVPHSGPCLAPSAFEIENTRMSAIDGDRPATLSARIHARDVLGSHEARGPPLHRAA
jgi:hypothetical protein